MTPVFEQAKIDVKDNGPKRPKDDVKVGLIGSGSAAPATVNAPVSKVQTGGFGDPNGIPGKGDPNHATNANRLGSPALPGGEGYGNGTGGKEGIRGTVASTWLWEWHRHSSCRRRRQKRYCSRQRLW